MELYIIVAVILCIYLGVSTYLLIAMKKHYDELTIFIIIFIFSSISIATIGGILVNNTECHQQKNN